MNFEDYIYQLKTNWKEKLSENEWFFSDFRENLISKLSQNDAFNAIPVLINFLLKENEVDLFSEEMELLNSLVRKANTTEVPENLIENLDKLNILTEKDSYMNRIWNDIKDYYYISS